MKNKVTQTIKKIVTKIYLLCFVCFLFLSNNANAQVPSPAWNTLGNFSTTDANYIGTNDPYPLILKTYNIEWMRIDILGNVGIGIATPGAKLEVAGQVKITGGTPGAGKVLTSDALGLSTWTTPTIGTVTSITAGTGLTGGMISSSGTIDLSIPVIIANGGTNSTTIGGAGSVIYSNGTQQVSTAVGTLGQVLTSAGAGVPTWIMPTSGTVTSVIGIAPIISSGGTAPDISITQAGTSTNGFISSTDWNVFNNKISGNGTLNYVPKWTLNGLTLGNSSIFDSDNGNVGIGTVLPQAKLEVKNGSVVFDGTTGNTLLTGAGTRMMWIPEKAAFRAGAVNYTQWDNANIGLYSAALGYSTTAESYACFVVGRFNRNSASYSKTTWVPTDPLFVVGNGANSQKVANALTVLKNGNVGIGTVTPSEKLDVTGLLKLPKANATQNDSPGLIFASDDDFLFTGRRFNHYGLGAYATNVGLKLYLSGRYGLNFFTGGINRMTIDKNGNVGIGTDLTINTDNYKLAVKGKIRADMVVVETNWSDFVFEKNYKLTPLAEIEQFIKQNGHLPEIPSAKEVETNGADLGHLVKLQMQKIEELTLYIIEQNKRIEILEQKH